MLNALQVAKSVLIVHRDAGIAESFSAIFEDEGIISDFVVSLSASEIQRKVSESQVDLILLDLYETNGNMGITIWEMMENKQIPVIFLTCGNASQVDKLRSEGKKMPHVIFTPVDIEDLVREVSIILYQESLWSN